MSSKRPTQIPRWAWGAAATLVQPPSGLAEAGYATRDEPAAQHFNWHMNAYGAWIDFLRGPDVEKWTRAQWPGTPATDHFDAPTSVAFDIDTITSDVGATDGAFRMAVIGMTNAPDAKMFVSQTGAQWEARQTNLAASITGPFALKALSTGRWLMGCLSGGGSPLIYYGAADDGAAVGPLGSESNSWTLATLPAGLDEVKRFAELGGAAKLCAATATTGVYSADNGATWVDCTFTTTPANNGLDVVSDGVKYVWISQDAEVYVSTDGVTFAATVTLAAGSGSWRLCAGGTGEVLAYKIGSATVVDVYYSEDSGSSWTAITPAAASPTRITQIAHRDGVWIATVSRSPWMWVSNDLTSWRALAPPVDTSAIPAALYNVRWDGGAWVAIGNGVALQCGRASDPATGAYVRDDAPSTLADAGSLRGYLISTTAPTNGYALIWNSGTSRWTPTAVGAGLPTASAASEVPVSTGAGTTYTARTMAQLRALMFSQTIDGLAGTGWTTTADAGTSWTWTAATRGRAHIDGGTGANEQVIVAHSTFLPNAEEYDLTVNVDVSSGDGTSTTTKQIVLRTGIDASNYVSFHIRSDGAVEILWNYTTGGTSGSLLGVTAVAAIDATARTDGNLFLRVTRRVGRLVFSYGIGAGGGALPTTWVQVYISPDSIAAGALAASQGTWVGLILYTPSSMVADYEVDFTAIRSVIGGGPL